MIDRRLLLLGLPAGALGVYLAQGVLSPAQIEFTRAAPAAPAQLELRPAVSTAHLELPIDLTRVAARAETVVAQRLAGTDTPAADPACSRRPNAADCAARADGLVEPAGPVRFEIHSGAVKLKVPVRVTEASASNEAGRSAATSITFSFAVRHQETTGFEITRLDDSASDGLAPGATPGLQRVLRQAEGRLRPAALAAHDELRQVLSAVPIVEATQQAWNALSEPMELGKGSKVWLRPVPELVGNGQLVAVDGHARFRIPIAARLSIDESGRGAIAPKRPAIHGQILTQTGSSIRIAANLPLDNLQRAADNVLVKSPPFEMKPDRFGPPVKVAVHRAKPYTSVRQIAFEFDITATRFEGETFSGKAHVVGRPHLDAGARLVTLADIALTPPVVREATAGRPHPNVPRLTAEPISSRLAEAARFDLTRELSEAVPRYSGLLHQRVGDNLALTARIEQATPVGIETTRDGAWLIADLSGDLTLTFDRGAAAAVAAAPTQPRAADATAPRQAGRTAAPEVVAAAVVSATAGAAAAQAARQAAAIPANAAPLSQATASPAAGGAATAARPQATTTTTSASSAGVPAAGTPAPVAATPLVKTAVPKRLSTPASTEAAAPVPANVKAKVLAVKPKPSNKVAGAKPNWIPFAQ